nr:MAG TPA: Herpesvirus UL33-like protein [Caudoviricetes sp.]
MLWYRGTTQVGWFGPPPVEIIFPTTDLQKQSGKASMSEAG